MQYVMNVGPGNLKTSFKACASNQCVSLSSEVCAVNANYVGKFSNSRVI